MTSVVVNNDKLVVQRRRLIKKPGLIALFLIALGVSILFAFPFVYMFLMSILKDNTEVLSYPPTFISATGPHFENYPAAMTYIDFMRKLGNTLLIMVCSMSLSLVSSIIVAYGFSRFDNKYSNIFFMVLLSTMMLPWVVTMIPAYTEFDALGWLGEWFPYPLVIPAIGGSAYNVFMIRQFMIGIPKDLDEAAKIDGCSSFRILWRIIVPQLKPVLATLFVFSFISGWSDFIGPSIYITDANNYTLAIAMQLFFPTNGSPDWVKVMAASIMYSIPLVLVIALCQKAFVRGQVGSAVK